MTDVSDRAALADTLARLIGAAVYRPQPDMSGDIWHRIGPLRKRGCDDAAASVLDHLDRTPATSTGDDGELVGRLLQVADHDWRVSLLAHTSDTAQHAANAVGRLSAERAADKAEIARLTVERDEALRRDGEDWQRTLAAHEMLHDEVEIRIAQAVKAERERCAAEAEAEGEDCDAVADTFKMQRDRSEASWRMCASTGRAVAQRIRGLAEPKEATDVE